MDSKQKMAVVGSGLMAAGVGLGIVGAALIVPAVFDWAVKLVDKGADEISNKVESASRTIGSAAGNLHRSFNAARKAGVEELKRGAV